MSTPDPATEAEVDLDALASAIQRALVMAADPRPMVTLPVEEVEALIRRVREAEAKVARVEVETLRRAAVDYEAFARAEGRRTGSLIPWGDAKHWLRAEADRVDAALRGES